MTRSWKFKLSIIAFVILAIFLIVNMAKSRLQSSFTVRMSRETVIQEMKALNRLETASYTIEKVIDAGTNGNTFQQILFGDRILLVAHGQVIAGFDLSKIKNSDVKSSGQTLRVTLPSPEILVTNLDESQTRVYDRRLGLLTQGNKDLESKARSEAQEVIREAACQGDILDEASKNARNQLTSLFTALGYTTVVLDIPRGSC